MVTQRFRLSEAPLLAAAGPLGEALTELLLKTPQTDGPWIAHECEEACDSLPRDSRLLSDLDAQRTWYVLAELTTLGVRGVSDAWAEHPAVSSLRWRLGGLLHSALVDALGMPESFAPEELPTIVDAELAGFDGPPMASYLATRGTLDNYRDFLRNRSIYHLREADPHSAAIPRITGRSKAALVEIQADEYGGGFTERMHSSLFAETMSTLGLDPEYGHYAEEVPVQTLLWSNSMTLFAARREWRGALVGHLLALEMTSCVPSRRYGNGLRRLGFGTAATAFFDEHVEADAVHEQLALHDMTVPLLEESPELAPSVLFGFRTALRTDAMVTEWLMKSWGPADTSRSWPD